MTGKVLQNFDFYNDGEDALTDTGAMCTFIKQHRMSSRVFNVEEENERERERESNRRETSGQRYEEKLIDLSVKY